jgi:predicted regulator of Ras-like GTPase activity (Roadblock/LC7/MglB family)
MKVDPRVLQAAEQAVALLMREVKGSRAAVVSTEDGFEVAARVENTAEVNRLSAMASSIAALGAIAGEESRIGTCDNVVIAGSGGHIVMRQIRRGDISLVLSLVASREAIVGQMLYFSRKAGMALEHA